MTETNSDHDGGGVPKQSQNASLTVLVASTLGASLSAVPQSQEAQAEGPIVSRKISLPHDVDDGRRSKSKSPERRTSHPVGPGDFSDLDSGSRKRTSLTRLQFNHKKSAGSESSRGQALTKRESWASVTSPPGMATAAARQESRTSLSSDHGQ